jgi:hypothetical protein
MNKSRTNKHSSNHIKLNLTRTTLRRLSTQELAAIAAGGSSRADDDTCTALPPP